MTINLFYPIKMLMFISKKKKCWLLIKFNEKKYNSLRVMPSLHLWFLAGGIFHKCTWFPPSFLLDPQTQPLVPAFLPGGASISFPSHGRALQTQHWLSPLLGWWWVFWVGRRRVIRPASNFLQPGLSDAPLSSHLPYFSITDWRMVLTVGPEHP